MNDCSVLKESKNTDILDLLRVSRNFFQVPIPLRAVSVSGFPPFVIPFWIFNLYLHKLNECEKLNFPRLDRHTFFYYWNLQFRYRYNHISTSFLYCQYFFRIYFSDFVIYKNIEKALCNFYIMPNQLYFRLESKIQLCILLLILKPSVQVLLVWIFQFSHV